MTATSHDRQVNVLVGPTCPTCASDDLRWGAPLGALWHGQCRDCGTEYRWFSAPVGGADTPPEVICPGCGVAHEGHGSDTAYCEDCGPSDCAYCGATTLRWQLSENRACSTCELGEAVA
jgi:hypothetical protein